MNTLIKLFATAFLVLGISACATTGSTSSSGSNVFFESSASSSIPATSKNSSPADTPSAFVPAIVDVPTDPEPDRTYRIGPEDLLSIEVFQVDELATKEPVNDQGLIIMPLIGSVKVSGLTVEEAEQTIASKLGERFLNNPQVTIFVLESTRQQVTVSGYVGKPGIYPVGNQTTLTQLVTKAGGVKELGNKDEILVFRKQENGKINAYNVDLAAIEEGKLADPLMMGDDRIVVPKSGAAVAKQFAGKLVEKSIWGLLAF